MERACAKVISPAPEVLSSRPPPESLSVTSGARTLSTSQTLNLPNLLFREHLQKLSPRFLTLTPDPLHRPPQLSPLVLDQLASKGCALQEFSLEFLEPHSLLRGQTDFITILESGLE